MEYPQICGLFKPALLQLQTQQVKQPKQIKIQQLTLQKQLLTQQKRPMIQLLQLKQFLSSWTSL